MNDGSWSRSSRVVFVVALVLVVGGGLLASLIQTAGGRVAVRDIRFVGSGGAVMSALLFVPRGVDAEHPAPGVLAVHGYINSRETQSGYAIELARRGYVVLELDQTGHGYSDPPALARGFGGPDGLAYLRSLDIVDPGRIALEGHSMGGWAVLIAAGVYPDGYSSVVASGSSTGTYGAPEGTPAWPRNFGLVFSRYDEFSQLMWGAAVPADIVQTEKLRTVFGTGQAVEPGRLYGAVADGTARMLYQPAVTHPGDHITSAGVGAAVDWIQRTVAAPNPIPPYQ
jgi:pimeloyl-ACP methyl ester carboxylesterase